MKPILVAVDLGELTPIVVEQAVRIAAAASCRLSLLYVGPAEADFLGQQILRKEIEGEEDLPEQLRDSYRQLRALEAELRGGGVETTSLFLLGKAIPSILDEARRQDAELIVIGSQNKGGVLRLLGSTSEGVLRGARCPVLVVPAPRDD